jgi:hypothetical protein
VRVEQEPTILLVKVHHHPTILLGEGTVAAHHTDRSEFSERSQYQPKLLGEDSMRVLVFCLLKVHTSHMCHVPGSRHCTKPAVVSIYMNDV